MSIESEKSLNNLIAEKDFEMPLQITNDREIRVGISTQIKLDDYLSLNVGLDSGAGFNVYRFNSRYMESLGIDSTQVETIRPDIFNPGYFSVFDILVHLHQKGALSLQYHFDESMNTHIIDELNGETDWWYQIYYSGEIRKPLIPIH